jgi:EAL domain-containing protein (putative c-di-GMP-specific phosphodiesterase class I)
VTAAEDAALDRVLRDDELRMVFQPIVRLNNREIVAFEALVRGAAGSSIESASAARRST